jgi:hypothetical protein
MRHLTDDIVLSVKDAMRNLRYAIRSQAHAQGSAWPLEAMAGGAEARAGARGSRRRSRVAHLVDRVFSEVESGALALVSPAREMGRGLAFPRPVAAYFDPANRRRDEAAERLFARAHYHAAKWLLIGFGLRNVLILEHAIGRARDAVSTRHSELVRRVCALPEAATSREAEADRVRLCAALTCALNEARPIRDIDFAGREPAIPAFIAVSPNAFCFAVTGLATAIASANDAAELPGGAEILDSARSVVELRFERLMAALAAEDAVEAVAREFDEVLPLLP